MNGGEPVGDHLSIGEVLAALHDEFPDITISKIRFLESQGLIDPERTPSGYRKFYADDVTRLRWILFQQKENFLPLKVIKDRLDQLSPSELATLDTIELPADDAAAADGEPADAAEPSAPEHGEQSAPARAAAPRSDPPARPALAPRRRSVANRPPAFAPTLPLDDGTDDGLLPSADDDDLATREAVCAAAGVTAEQLASLEEYGLIAPARESGDDVRFDTDAIETAAIAAGFFARGLEARHLRMYRTFAEREAGLFGQVLLPYLRQRNPDSRARLQSELVELANLGRRLRTVQLRDAVRDSLSE
ncbi:MAG: MerR family transcriptional regulator [Acidimicrobiia bacterium]